MNQPSVGRIVHFFTSASGHPDDIIANAAIVVRVNNVTNVDLYVLDPDEYTPYYAASITQGRREGRWDWPPKV